MIPFAAHAAAQTPSAFQWAGKLPKLPLSVGDVNPHLMPSSLGPLEFALQMASRSVQPFAQYISVSNIQTQTDTQTTLHVSSVAIGRICAIHAISIKKSQSG